MRYWMICLIAALTAPSAHAAERRFSIGATAFAEHDIIDARAQPDLGGQATILITFSAAAAKRLETETAAHIGKPVDIKLDDTVLMSPIVREPIAGGTLQISGGQISGGLTFEAAVKLAKSISGKDPLPDDLQE
ncbi:MAG: hypothetical protein ABL918_12435 [Chakrabartia sp.]